MYPLNNIFLNICITYIVLEQEYTRVRTISGTYICKDVPLKGSHHGFFYYFPGKLFGSRIRK